jgi:adenylate cyclase
MSRRRTIETLIVLALVVGVFASVMWAWRSGSLMRFELVAYDHWTKASTRRADAQAATAVFVAIDEDYLDARAVPSVTDEDLAVAVEMLRDAGASAIGIDLVRNFTMPPGEARLAELLRVTPNVFGVVFGITIDARSYIRTPAHDALPEERVALYNLLDDPIDARVRRATLSGTYDGEEYFTLAYVLAETHLTARDVSIGMADDDVSVRIGRATFTPIGRNFGGYIGKDDSGYQFMIDYDLPQRTLKFLDLIEGRIDPATWQDRMVVVGYGGGGGSSKKDYVATPLGEFTDGPLVHAIIAQQIVRSAMTGRAPIRDWAERVEVALLLVAVLVGCVVGQTVRSPWVLAAVLACGLAALIGGSAWLLGRGTWVPIVPSSLGLLATGIVVTSWQRYRERKDRIVLMDLFGQHVSDQVAQTIWRERDQILTSGRLKTVDLLATCMFTDLQGFTRVSENLGPQGTVDWLNQYLDRMGRLVIEHGGMINKYMGDAIMALFGVPVSRQTPEAIAADACAAVACAVAMREALQPLNAELAQRGLPEITLRIGVFTGPLVAGSVGSTDRLEYTVIGDSVNVASRLESYDKSRMEEQVAPRHCRILIGEETLERLDGRFEAPFVAEDEVHNRQKPVRIHAVLGRVGSENGGLR